MKLSRRFFVGIMAAFFALTIFIGCGNGGGAASPWYQSEVLELVNVEREKESLEPLILADDKAQAAAQLRANEIIEKLAHERPDGTYCDTLLTEYGVEWYYCGENIAYGLNDVDTSEKAVEAWMNSEGHRANILNETYTKLAVGYVERRPVKAPSTIGCRFL